MSHRAGTSEVKTLREGYAHGRGGARGGAALDPFEDRLAAEVVRQCDGVANDAPLGLVVLEIGAERVAHLNERGLDADDQREVRIGGAMVVEREAEPELAELVEHAP